MQPGSKGIPCLPYTMPFEIRCFPAVLPVLELPCPVLWCSASVRSKTCRQGCWLPCMPCKRKLAQVPYD